MKRRHLFFYIAVIFTTLGVVGIIATEIITDPYISRPSFLIAILSFITAGISLLLLKKENIWLKVAFFVIFLFTSSTTCVVISKYVFELNKAQTRGIIDEFYDLNVLKLDSQNATFEITISFSNPDAYEVRLNKISLEVINTLFPEVIHERPVKLGSVEWMPLETIKARNRTKISTIFTTNDVEIVSYLVNKVKGQDRLILGVKGYIWYEEKGQEFQRDFSGTAFQFF